MQETINFDLSLPEDWDELPIPLMLARGYRRQHVVSCFEKLQELGYGKFERGSQGRGNVAKFVPNNKCPNEYSMFFTKKKRGRPRKVIEE